MLRVTVEIWPGGDKTRARAVAIANVANLSDLVDVSDYAVSVTEGHNPATNTPPWSRRGYGALIDLKKAPDGTYYAESKPNPKSKNGRFSYRAPESIVDPETPERSSDGVSQSTSSNVDMTTNPIAGFDPNAGFL